MNHQRLLTFPLIVILLALVCSLLWGSAFPCVKIGFRLFDIESSTPGKLYFAAFRFLLAGALILAGVRLCGRSIRLPRKKDYALMVVLGLVHTTFQYTFFYIGLSHTTGMKASIINGAGSFFLVIYSHWFVKNDRVAPGTLLGLFLGFSGLVLINVSRTSFSPGFHFMGEGFILCAALASVAAMVIVKDSSMRIYPPLVGGYQLFFGALGLLAVSLATDDPGVLHWSASGLALCVYLSFVSAAAFPLWYALVKYNSLSKMAVYRFLIPVCGTVLSAALLDAETFNVYVVVSLVLVSAGMILTSLGSSG